MEEKKKRKSGYDILKGKIANLENQLSNEIENRKNAEEEVGRVEESFIEQCNEIIELKKDRDKLKQSLRQSCDKLNKVIESQNSSISTLRSQLHDAQREWNLAEKKSALMWRYLGPIRRWIFTYKVL